MATGTEVAPIVSIGMPVFNGGDYLREALDSLLSQSEGNFELIISDNASTDSTASICESYLARDKRVRYVRQPRNVGAAQNFQFVLDESRAKYFMWAAADDEWKRTYIECCLAQLRAQPDLAAVAPGFNVISRRFPFARLTPTTLPDLEFLSRRDAKERVWNFVLLDEGSHKANVIYGLWKTEIIRQEQFSFSNYQHCSDADIQILTAVLCEWRIGRISNVLFTKKYRSLPPGYWLERMYGGLLAQRTFVVANIKSIFRRPAFRQCLNDARRERIRQTDANLATLIKTLSRHFDNDFCSGLAAKQALRIRRKLAATRYGYT